MRISDTSKRLKEIMKEEHLKQVDIIAKASFFSAKYDTKITKTDLSQYVSGKVEPGQAKLFVLASALNVNEAWLMGYDVPKQRNIPSVINHTYIRNDVINAVQILAMTNGYDFSFFSNVFQIKTKDFCLTLSPTEVDDLINQSLEQIHFVIRNICINKLNSNISSIKSDRVVYDENLNAAHERTDIDVTEDMKKHDNDIMDDDNF